MRKLKDILAEQAKAEQDDRDLRSRTDARHERKRTENALADLARQLVALSDRQLAGLDLPERLRNAVGEARAIRSARARDRAIRVVRKELRNGDADSIEAQLGALGTGRKRPRR